MGHGNHHHLWAAVWSLFPKNNDPVAEKEQRLTAGALIKWRTSLRDERWIVHYRPTGKPDVVSGEEIVASEYWIADDTVRLTPRRTKPQRTTVDDLKRKWSKPT